jgi:hypothetical protein
MNEIIKRKTAGIKPISNFDDNLLSSLKQNILLFDLVGIPALDTAIEQFNRIHKPNCGHRYIIDEIEYLREEGYLFNSLEKTGGLLKYNEKNIYQIGKEFNYLSKIIKTGNDSELSMEAFARLSCLILNNEIIERDYYSLPLINRLKLPDSHSENRIDVVNLVLENIPLPNENTPWEDIFEFKRNPDNKGRLAGLRYWINKAVNSGFTAPEIRDELEFFLYQYRKSLEIHKIKYQTGILKTIVVGSAEILESVVKLKFSNIAKGLFSAQQSKAELLNAELTSPGHELSYIYKAQSVFKQ